MSLRDRRVQYETAGLDRDDLHVDPMVQWQRWYDEAESAGVTEPNAMTLSTIGADGIPDSRVVLARGADERGFVFYTNLESVKSRQLEAGGASAVFAWLDLHRQVRVRGSVERVSDAESDGYFASRPRGSQIGAWASPQSRPIADRAALERLVEDTTRRFEGVDVPRPPYWGGFVLRPIAFEFWQGRPSRLHDRFRYAFVGSSWNVERLAP
ncbi:MAG: pyridoxamine 5'-phosphate oxidase [Ilumatobacteraceae bacterium]